MKKLALIVSILVFISLLIVPLAALAQDNMQTYVVVDKPADAEGAPIWPLEVPEGQVPEPLVSVAIGNEVQVDTSDDRGDFWYVVYGEYEGLMAKGYLERVQQSEQLYGPIPIYRVDPQVNAQPAEELDNWNELEQIPEWVRSESTIPGVMVLYLQSSTGQGEDPGRLIYGAPLGEDGQPDEMLAPIAKGEPFVVPEGSVLEINAFYAEVHFQPGDDGTQIEPLLYREVEPFPQQGIFIALPAGTRIQHFVLVDGAAAIVPVEYAQMELCNRLATAVVNDWAREVVLVPTDWPAEFCGDTLRIMPVDERPGGDELPDLTPIDVQ